MSNFQKNLIATLIVACGIALTMLVAMFPGEVGFALLILICIIGVVGLWMFIREALDNF